MAAVSRSSPPATHLLRWPLLALHCTAPSILLIVKPGETAVIATKESPPDA